MIEKGTVLQGRYRIEKKIGQGGMGKVYLATDERFDSLVAVKGKLFSDNQHQKAFKREARLLNSLKHSALPKVSDHFVEGNGQYIVMEYIGGDDLFEKIEKKGEAFPFEDVLNWTHQLLDALEYLHNQEKPIIHRDIKPQNLKLTSEGKIILLDFGLAKGNPTDAKHHTAANSVFGYSLDYASLEQIQGTGTDPRSDIYSLATTMYHLATGKPPSDALTRVMLTLNDKKDPLEPVHKVNSKVPESFGRLLEKAMSLSANKRLRTASEMRKMLIEMVKTGVFTEPTTYPEKLLKTDVSSSYEEALSTSDAFSDPITYPEKTLKTDVSLPNKKTSSDSEKRLPPTDERKTEVLPATSKETKLVQGNVVSRGASVTSDNYKGDGVIAQSILNRSGRMMASILGLFILTGSLIAGVYFFNSKGFGVSNSKVNRKGAEAKSSEVKNVKKNKDLKKAETNISAQDINTKNLDKKESPPDVKKTPVKSKKRSRKPRKRTLKKSNPIKDKVIVIGSKSKTNNKSKLKTPERKKAAKKSRSGKAVKDKKDKKNVFKKVLGLPKKIAAGTKRIFKKSKSKKKPKEKSKNK